MNFGELVTAVIVGDFEPENAAGLEDSIKEWLNEGYLEIASRDLSPFEQEDIITLETGVTDYDLFDDYRKMYNMRTEENGPITFQDKRRFDYVRHHMGLAADTGPPKDAIIVGKIVRIQPIPDKEYEAICTYYHIPERMVADNATHLLTGDKENLLIIFAQSKFLFREKDRAGSKELKNEFEAKLMRWEVEEFNNRVTDNIDIIQLEREYYSRFGRRVH